jgi:catechol 2,3-dioxygenase-like lactoylglutathione lyase family enzyme
MSYVHVHLHVANLEASRSFYERFLGATPVKVKPGYLKFLPDLAPINLALSAGAGASGKNVDHLGFQVESKQRVTEILTRVKQAGLAVREEMGTDCCFANQDKFWVVDPDGIEWEVYHLNYDLEADDVAAPAAGCCPTADRPLTRLGKRPPPP